MLKEIDANKEWVFSGIGVFILSLLLSLLVFIYKKYFSRKEIVIENGVAKIPVIINKNYKVARALLIKNGWIPNSNHWSKGDSNEVSLGNGPCLWGKGYHELISSSGTGYSQCLFSFKDIHNNNLTIITCGEAIKGNIETILVTDVQLRTSTTSII